MQDLIILERFPFVQDNHFTGVAGNMVKDSKASAGLQRAFYYLTKHES